MKALELTEINTLLAGLRLLETHFTGNQYYGTLPSGIYDILTDAGEDQPPTVEALDELAVRINLGTVYVEDDDDYGNEEYDEIKDTVFDDSDVPEHL